MEARLIWITPDAERTIAYAARVSSLNRDNPEYERLMRSMLRRNEWSPFQMVNACIEITTSRDISQQLIRHWSMNFLDPADIEDGEGRWEGIQEYSQRYAPWNGEFEFYRPRPQGLSDRQVGEGELDQETLTWWLRESSDLLREAREVYFEALKRGVAREVARSVLPAAASTTIVVNATLRSWIHYIALRDKSNAQEEHRHVAEAVKDILVGHFPVVFSVLGMIKQEEQH